MEVEEKSEHDGNSNTSSASATGVSDKKKTRKLHTEHIRVIDAFQTPRFQYRPVRKVFSALAPSPSLHGSAQDKADVLRERFAVLKQRILRNDLFTPSTVNRGSNNTDLTHYQLTLIESLIGTPGPKCIFGMLTELVEGKHFIEDLNASVPIDISDPKLEITKGLYTDNCFVIALGELIDGIFKVSGIGFPPPEPRDATINVYPNLSCFGIEFKTADRQKEALHLDRMLKNRPNDLVIVLSDVHLDKPKVMEKLKTMFEGLEPAMPPVFIFAGNFLSQRFPANASWHDMKRIKQCFDNLCDLILEFPSLAQNSRFIFVPGPGDAGVSNVLPRPSIPDIFTQRLRDRLPFVTFASNPCRLLYFNKEIVIFREDLLHKMRRSCVKLSYHDGPQDNAGRQDETEVETSQILVKSVLDQGHLCPIPFPKRPVYWNYDHALKLYPMPHTLILADSVDQYEWIYQDCQAFNPGSFACDYSFVVYFPAKNKTEFSRID